MKINFFNRTQKISLSQVDFKEYFEFYRDFICPYIYTYELEDKNILEISFSEENFGHLLGLHKLETFKKFKNSFELKKEILTNNKSIKEIKFAEKNKLNNIELKDRLTYFPVLKTLLENTTSVLKYDLNIIWNSKIEFSFLLRSDKIAVLVYLAVKEIRNGKKICVPVSLLVDRNDRFLKSGLTELKIKSMKIVNKI